MYRVILDKDRGEKMCYKFDFNNFDDAIIFIKKIIESGYAISLECI